MVTECCNVPGLDQVGGVRDETPNHFEFCSWKTETFSEFHRLKSHSSSLRKPSNNLNQLGGDFPKR